MKAELLAPAGNFEKLKTAIYFGADAVYLGGKLFSLRNFSENFSDEELYKAVEYAHSLQKKVYVCVNVFAKNEDFSALERHLKIIEKSGADAVILSDPGIFRLLKRTISLPVHISTQANTLSYEAALFWRDLGAERVILARELSIDEIAKIHALAPELELEAFVHGAMCISYSGRCLLSDYLDGRSSNRGACVQACRWNYQIRASQTEGEWMELEEDGRGSYLLNSKDLNLLRYLDELSKAGVSSFKIEGRMKSEYYLATVVNAYRRAMDGEALEPLERELLCVSGRAFTTAYALGKNPSTVSYDNSQTKGECDYIANVLDWKDGRISVEMRNRFFEGDLLEVLSPSENFRKAFPVLHMKEGESACEDAKRVQGIYTFDCPYPLKRGDLLRRRR